MSFLSTRWTLGLVMLALVGCSANAKQHDTKEVGASAPDGTRVEVAIMHPTSAQVTLNLTGEIEGSRDANLASSLGGYVETVKVEAGDKVRAGQLLVGIDRRLHAASLEQAKAQAEMAEVEHQRLIKLGDGVSKSQVYQASIQSRIAKAQADQAAVRFSRASVSAPFNGVVSVVAVEQGEVAGPGTTVARLVQLDPVSVMVSVADRDVVALKEGMNVSVSANARSSMYTGVVKTISSTGDARTRAFNVEIEVPNPDRELLPGMVTRVTVDRAMGQAFVIPQDWVLSKPGGHGVFVENAGVAEWKDVQLGDVLRNQVVVSSGLNDNDHLIMVGHRELLAGDAVLVSREGQCCKEGRVFYGTEGTEQ